MNKKMVRLAHHKIVIAIAIAVLAVGGLVAYKSYTSYRTYTTDTIDTSYTTDATDLQSAPAAARYVNKRYGFSFDKPEGYTVGALAEGEGEMVLVQPSRINTDMKTRINTEKSGFQIYITPLDQLVELTPDFIKKDLPGTAVNNPQAIVLDGKAKGLMFDSNSEAFSGDGSTGSPQGSFEIWFVYKPQMNADAGARINADTTYLYQITSYAEFADQLRAIMGTWKFE